MTRFVSSTRRQFLTLAVSAVLSWGLAGFTSAGSDWFYSYIVATTYYSDATHTTYVGEHVINYCSLEQYSYGEVTAYYTTSTGTIICH